MRCVRIILLWFSVQFVVSISIAQNLDFSSALANGKYKIEGEEDLVIVIRGNKQIEKYSSDKSKVISRLEWLDRETYELTPIKYVNFKDANGCLGRNEVIRVKVIKFENEKLSCVSYSRNCPPNFFDLVKL